QVTRMAYNMVTVFGMNRDVGQVSFYRMMNDQFRKPYSDSTASKIDDEVRSLVESQYIRAQELLKDKRQELEILANELL
ncbi:MAG: AAA family ATPase, partial [Phaeodactylibacter sp.]|nr:AAA family ATPase [Phaeodactylibacter sp.]